MRWNPETRYKLLLKINNAAIEHTTGEALFKAVATELNEHFDHDRLSINLYDAKTQSISYFATADGILPKGISNQERRPLAKGAIVQMVVQSGQPVVIDDLTRYSDHSSIGAMVRANLKSTMAFPLNLRGEILGTIHFSFKEKPLYISELTEVLAEVSNQIAIAVDNMRQYTQLKQINADLIREKRYLLSHSNQPYQQDSFIYESPSMVEIINIVEHVADTDATVLLTGETGTGKDYLARYIHNLSPRKENLFVKTNCHALTPSLFESELFGHAKGAFTGALNDRAGRFELAQHGTVFLDEIGELPVGLQAKLLHVLEDRRFERVGDSRPRDIDFRIISATNCDLPAKIDEGLFRKDLYYRLNTISIRVPPLRQRIEDIPILLNKLTTDETQRVNRPAPTYTSEAIEMLCGYAWPGNIRELKNFVKRLIIMRPGQELGADAIRKELPVDSTTKPPANIFQNLADAERCHIERALAACNGAVGGPTGAAKLLAVPRSTLQYRLKKYGLSPSDYT
jgi:formate hydrogenlyase transcriptional activator